MTFEELINEAVGMLQRLRRVSYRSMQRQFDLDDDNLDDLKEALLYTHSENVNDEGQGLAWTGEPPIPLLDAQPDTERETRFQAVLPLIIDLLQRELRVPYHTLKYGFGLDEALLSDVRGDLDFRRLAQDENGEGLVWTGELPLVPLTSAISPSQLAPLAYRGGASTESRPDNPIIELEPDPGSPVAERRQLTVMFCDLVGSTDLSGKLDPEDLREVVKAYQETAAVVIARYEGHIAQYLGDGLLVYFGWPQAHENDAERAVYTGLEIPEAIAELNTSLTASYGVQLSLRIGIHTGPVVVGEMGGGERRENLALGATPNIAARLEALAKPNTAVVSAVTAQLVQMDFVLEELGRHELKGVSEAMMLYAVVAPREAASDDHEEMFTGGFDALVGRDEEQGLLLRRWEQSKDSQGQVVLISGEAGLGKSSLVEGLRAHVREEGQTHVTFRCSPYTTNSAMHPVIEYVQRRLGWERDDPTVTKLDKLERAIKPTSLPMEETVPLLADLLSLPMTEGRYPTLTFSPQKQRQLTLDALVAWMLEEVERQPVLMIWEDIHWADPSTLELLGLFIDQVPTLPMLHVLAFRPEFSPPWPMGAHLTPITLNRLERRHIEVLVRRLAGGKRLPSEVVTHIVTKTDGVPLYVEELTKMLLESDLLEAGAEQYILTGSLSSAAIPDSLQSSLLARLDRLPEAREAAQLGAVLGREFSYDMIQSLAAMDDAALQTRLGQLVSHELLYQRGRIPRATYIFRHALIRDAAYASLLRRTRQQIHRQVAELLEGTFSDVVETQPEQVAYHYTEAGLHELAIAYWQRAGQREIDRSAYQEALNHLTTGLDLLQELPESPERHQLELPLQIAFGASTRVVKGHAAPEIEAAYTRARVLCQQLGDAQDMFPILHGLWRFYLVQADLYQARQLGETLLGLAERQDEIPLYVMAHYALGTTCLALGELPLARYHLEAGIERYTPDQRRSPMFRAGQDPGVAMRVFAAHTLWGLGYPNQALARALDAIALATELDHPYSQAFAFIGTLNVYQFCRAVQDVANYATAVATLSTDHGFTFWLTYSQPNLGWAMTAQGQQEEGLAQMRQGIAAYRADGVGFHVPYFLSLLAEGYLGLNQIEAGLGALSESIAVMERTGQRWYEAELHRLQGECLLRQSSDNHADTETCFHKALDVARKQHAKSLELRAATSLARLWQSQDKRQDAYDLLAPVYEWFTEGFDTADLQEAKALLTELGA